MFMIVFLFAIIGFITGGIRFFVCWIAEGVKHDRFSPERKRAWRNVWIHFGVSCALVYIAMKM